MNRNKKPKPIAGFAMLFAVLASSLLIALGISIFNISLKELQISTSEKDSQAAYYAADSAEECALYSDIILGAFPTCLDSGCSLPSTTTSPTITCNGNPITLNSFSKSGLAYSYSTSTFFSYGDITMPSAGISITKTFCPAGIIAGNCNFSVDTINTMIISEGLNSSIIGRRVERGIQEIYNSGQ